MATEPILYPEVEIKPCGAPRIISPDGSAHQTRNARSIQTSPATWPRPQFFHLLAHPAVKTLLFLAGDVAAVMVAHHMAEAVMRRSMNIPNTFLNPPEYFLFYVPFFTALLYLLQGYKNPDLRRPEKELELLFKGVSISFVALACANFVFFKSSAFSRYLLVVWYALALVCLLAARFSLRAAYGALWRRGLARQTALLLGSPAGLAGFQRRLAIQRYQGFEIAGILLEPSEAEASGSIGLTMPVLGGLEDWEAVADAEGARRLVVHLDEMGADHSARLLEIVRRCQEKGLEIEVYSKLFGTTELRYERDEFSGYFRFYAPPRWSRVAQRLMKSALDVLIGLVGSAVTIAITPVVGLFIKLEDGGAIFFGRDYIGSDGRVHRFLKFRTMVTDAEQILENDPALKTRFECSFKLKDDPRILRVGRFLRKYSLDEFPQFFSLLTGQLTFVGPRAITPAARERYGSLLPKLLSMKPGLTGFWQVMGRQTTTYEEKIQMDMFYIDHWSIWLDLVILAKTFWEVLRAKGAY
jgi:exopolysaccharide biosynthesis polyprenyl glycosylphosphotransferase